MGLMIHLKGRHTADSIQTALAQNLNHQGDCSRAALLFSGNLDMHHNPDGSLKDGVFSQENGRQGEGQAKLASDCAKAGMGTISLPISKAKSSDPKAEAAVEESYRAAAHFLGAGGTLILLVRPHNEVGGIFPRALDKKSFLQGLEPSLYGGFDEHLDSIIANEHLKRIEVLYYLDDLMNSKRHAQESVEKAKSEGQEAFLAEEEANLERVNLAIADFVKHGSVCAGLHAAYLAGEAGEACPRSEKSKELADLGQAEALATSDPGDADNMSHPLIKYWYIASVSIKDIEKKINADKDSGYKAILDNGYGVITKEEASDILADDAKLDALFEAMIQDDVDKEDSDKGDSKKKDFKRKLMGIKAGRYVGVMISRGTKTKEANQALEEGFPKVKKIVPKDSKTSLETTPNKNMFFSDSESKKRDKVAAEKGDPQAGNDTEKGGLTP